MLKRALSFKSLPLYLLSSGFLMLIVASCACTDNRRPEANTQDNRDKNNEIAQATATGPTQTSVKEAIAKVHPYPNYDISGLVTFTKVPGGIKVVADIDGLTPGKHGFHVHEHGDCSGKDGMKAGGHFNPTNSKHGGPDSPERHVGDLGNLEADEDGHAHYERIDKLISFEGRNSILGRSIIIHADPDDYVTQPTGNSGARIACGKIEAVEDQSANNF
jgi:Cu-Zn family superoxide dismutase